MEPLTRWDGPNIRLSVVSVNPLWTSCRVRREHRTLIDTSREIWIRNEKSLIPIGGVVAVDPSAENGRGFRALTVKECIDPGAGIPTAKPQSPLKPLHFEGVP